MSDDPQYRAEVRKWAMRKSPRRLQRIALQGRTEADKTKAADALMLQALMDFTGEMSL